MKAALRLPGALSLVVALIAGLITAVGISAAWADEPEPILRTVSVSVQWDGGNAGDVVRIVGEADDGVEPDGDGEADDGVEPDGEDEVADVDDPELIDTTAQQSSNGGHALVTNAASVTVADGGSVVLSMTFPATNTATYRFAALSCVSGSNPVLLHEWDATIGTAEFAGVDVNLACTVTITATSWRLGGASRYETASLLAEQFGPARAVVIANGEARKNGFDALAANYLAGQVQAPIMLTRARGAIGTTGTTMPDVTATAVCAALTGDLLGPPQPGDDTRVVYVLGKTDSVPADQEAWLADPTCDEAVGRVAVVRIGGKDRYETAAYIVDSDYRSPIGSFSLEGGDPLRTAFVVSGQVNADALSVGPLAAKYHLPVLLTRQQALPAPAIAAIRGLGIEQVVVLGGSDRISTKVLTDLGAAGASTIVSIAGDSRSDTAVQLYELAGEPLGSGFGWHGTSMALANGWTGFPDALAAGPVLAQSDGGLLLVSGDALQGTSAMFLKRRAAQFDSILGLGSDATVSSLVLQTAAALVN